MTFCSTKDYAIIYGIDVSKDTLDICKITCHSDKSDVAEFFQISNTTLSICNWIANIKQEKCFCVLEHTGAYSSRLIDYLARQGQGFSVVSPLKSHSFMQVQGIVSKDDKQAAHSLALMGQKLDLALYQSKSDSMKKRKQLLMGVNALQKQQQALENQLHALSHQIVYAPQVVQALEESLQTVQTQLEKLEDELADLSDDEKDEQFELITSIKGIGDKTAHLLLAATGGLHQFEQAGQVSKFVGLVPYSHFSGSSIKKRGHITKRGNRKLKASLYMAAHSAKKYNHACKELYERLTKAGKPHKKAIVAVMNKLVRQAFGVVLAGIPFDNQHYLKYQ